MSWTNLNSGGLLALTVSSSQELDVRLCDKYSITVKWRSFTWMKQPASREVCYNNSELQVVAPAATWKKIQWKTVKNWMFLTRDIKSIFILTSLIGFSLISSQEFYIIWAFWRCLEHLDTHFLFISHWSLKNWILWCEIQAILLKCQGGVFSLQYSGNIYFSFSSAACCTSQKMGGHWW